MLVLEYDHKRDRDVRERIIQQVQRNFDIVNFLEIRNQENSQSIVVRREDFTPDIFTPGAGGQFNQRWSFDSWGGVECLYTHRGRLVYTTRWRVMLATITAILKYSEEYKDTVEPCHECDKGHYEPIDWWQVSCRNCGHILLNMRELSKWEKQLTSTQVLMVRKTDDNAGD